MTSNIYSSRANPPTKARQLRTIEIDGAPWFCGADVIACLGLRKGTSQHYAKLESDEQSSINRIVLGMKPGLAARRPRLIRFTSVRLEARRYGLPFATVDSGIIVSCIKRAN